MPKICYTFFLYTRFPDALPHWLWLGKDTGITWYYIDLSPFDIVLVLLQSWSQISSEKLKRENIRNSVKNIIRIWENSKKRREKLELIYQKGELKEDQPTTRSRHRLAIDLPKEASKKRRLGDSEQNLPRGKRMV